MIPVYLSTQGGDADVLTNVITFLPSAVFSDEFESGDILQW